MHSFPRGRLLLGLGLLGSALLLAQDWHTLTQLPGVDFAGLTPRQKADALRILRNHNCDCTCGRKEAQCRVEDPGCSWSKGWSQAVIDALRDGKSESDALAAANASHWGHPPGPTKLLDEPVTIPTEGSPVTGPADAQVTLVEFSDFQCPYCWKAVARLDAVLKAYPKQVKLIFKEFPLDSHSHAALAAQAAIAAHNQGKFWPMYEALFANHANLARPVILAQASKIGLDMNRFNTDLDSPATRRVVERDTADGEKAGVEGTPTVYINGQRYNGSLELDAIKPIIDAELKKIAQKK
jgi:protein-disulfide isomerase